MEARAIKRFLRSSPRKMRLVIDLIRGKRADEALAILQFSPKHAARDAAEVLKSAVANYRVKFEESDGYDPGALRVKTVHVDPGPMMKRISPAPMGRAYRIRKRSHHLTIVVSSAV